MSPWGCGGLFTVGVWPGVGPRLGRACPGTVYFSLLVGVSGGKRRGVGNISFWLSNYLSGLYGGECVFSTLLRLGQTLFGSSICKGSLVTF